MCGACGIYYAAASCFLLVVTCNEVVIAHSSKDPDLATYNYTDIVNYTCDTGYELTAGILQRMCTASGTWAGTAPTCSSKVSTRSRRVYKLDAFYFHLLTCSCFIQHSCFDAFAYVLNMLLVRKSDARFS